MSSYISRVFARPQLTTTTTPSIHDPETELAPDDDNTSQDPKIPTNPTRSQDVGHHTTQTSGQPSTSRIVLDKPSEDQFQIMLSSILAQNSNLLAQNNEQARVIDRLSICLTEAEARQKDLMEEMRGMFKSIMDVFGTLQGRERAGNRAGTPISNSADTATSTATATLNNGSMSIRDGMVSGGQRARDDFSGLINSHEGEYPPETIFWNRDKGKNKETGLGVDPSVLRRPTFSALDTPTDQGQEIDLNMNMDGWNDDRDHDHDHDNGIAGEIGEDLLNSIARPRRQPYVQMFAPADNQYGCGRRGHDRNSAIGYRPTSRRYARPRGRWTQLLQ